MAQKKEKKQLLIFKVDFEKAFDSISWNYLDHILDTLGFGLKWHSWIKTCLSSSRASILVNGSPTFEFSINCSLRQGDPLSPFLFIFIMEGLHNVFVDAVGNGMISGINNSSINISYLFFADDVIITIDWNARDLENIIRVLHVFYLASGLKINIHKSNIYGIGVNEDGVYNMASNTGCIAGSLGIYYLSTFRAPESVLNDLERIWSNFFWGGNQDGKKMAWVKWPIILNSSDNGGLNIGSLKAFNLALLQKWGWRLFTSPNDLWVKVVKAFHGHKGGFDNNGCSFEDHILFECIIASDLWKLVSRWCEILFVQAFPLRRLKIGYPLGMLLKEKNTGFSSFLPWFFGGFEDSEIRQFDFILDGLAEVPSNDRVFGQWLNALFQKAAFYSRLLPRGLFGVSSKTTSE
ncbi:RNA-directed DNA polymerase, eukaryota, reverse transcriptase zinc-binding domain protein [Tanacetum coccineum]